MALQLYRMRIGSKQHPSSGVMMFDGELFLEDTANVPAAWLIPGLGCVDKVVGPPKVGQWVYFPPSLVATPGFNPAALLGVSGVQCLDGGGIDAMSITLSRPYIVNAP